MSFKTSRRYAIFAALLAFSASCASIPPTNYYVLGLPRESRVAPAESKYPYSVVIEPFESESVYMRKKIVWRAQSNRVGYYSYDRWASLPGEMFTFRLFERSLGSGLFARVSTEGTMESADLIISGKIVAFEEVDDTSGHYGKVAANIQIADKDGVVLWSGLESQAEPVAGEDIDAVVKAIAAATDAVITQALGSIDSALEGRDL